MDAGDLLRCAVLRRVGTSGRPRRQKSWKESVVKCSNPDCNRGIGLVAYGRVAYGRAGSASGATVQSIAAMRS